MSLDKPSVYNACLTLLEQRAEELANDLENLKESAESDTKSSMGDKYETAREMINLEKGKLAERMDQVSQMKAALHSLDALQVMHEVKQGALVRIESGYCYISIGLGHVEVGDEKIWVISPMAPLSRAMLGKKKGDMVNMAGKTQQIISIH